VHLATEAELKDRLNNPNISHLNKALLVLSLDSNSPKSTARIRELLLNYGVRDIGQNLSSTLYSAKGKAIKTPAGWELSLTGIKFVSEIFGLKCVVEENNPVKKRTADTLRAHASKIQNNDSKGFVEESIECFESELYRSAVVLSWVGAMAVLYDYVLANKLTDFNAELKRRDFKAKSIKNTDDFRTLKESTCLDILESVSVIGGDVKTQLKQCLDLRNSCGHPNSLKIGEHSVAAHIEKLILNVFSVYS
jgi:hypothetical protein